MTNNRAYSSEHAAAFFGTTEMPRWIARMRKRADDFHSLRRSAGHDALTGLSMLDHPRRAQQQLAARDVEQLVSGGPAASPAGHRPTRLPVRVRGSQPEYPPAAAGQINLIDRAPSRPLGSFSDKARG